MDGGRCPAHPPAARARRRRDHHQRPAAVRGAALSARRIVLPALTLAAWIAAAAAGLAQIRYALDRPTAGLDFAPVRHAAEALLDGRSIYTDPAFVYPPTAAPAFLPTSLGSFAQALDVWIYLSAAALVAAALLAAIRLRSPWWPLVAALGSGLLLRSDVTRDSLWLGNLSLLLVPVAVGVLLCFELGWWTAGCALLGASLLVKPILAPLLLLPILRRRWRALALAAAPALVLLLLATLVVPGAENFAAILERTSQGGVLTGRLAVYNLSLKGLGERLGADGIFLIGRVAVAALVLATVVAWYRRPQSRGATAAAGTSVLLGVFLAGTLSESHFLLIAMACLLLALTALRDLRPLLWALPGLAVLFVPRAPFGSFANSEEALQVRYVLGEVLLLIAAAAGAVMSRGGLTALERRAVAERALTLATRRLSDDGWTVEDVRATHEYDLRCERGEDRLYAEVRGATGPLASVVSPAEEKRETGSIDPQTALIVVHGIELRRGDEPTADWGTLHMIRPWRPDEPS